MRIRLRTAVLAACLPAAVAATAATAGSNREAARVQPTERTTLTIASAQERDCVARRYERGTAGTAAHDFTAVLPGHVHLRLRGPARGEDWDLALFDAAGRRIAGSQSFGANEVVSAYVSAGDVLTAQACRRSGSSRSHALETTFTHIPARALGAAPQRASVARVRIPGRRGVDLLRSLGLDVTHNVTRKHASVILHSDAERRTLSRSGLSFRTETHDLAARDALERRREARWSRSVGGRSAIPSGRTTYRTYEETQAELKKLVAAHPDKVRPITLPNKSFQGRTVEGVEIANDVNGADGRPTFVLVGMHHSREWPAVEAPMEFANLLLSDDPRGSAAAASTRTIIVPIINPDGYVESRSSPLPDDPDGDLGVAGLGPTYAYSLSGTGPYRRKNCFGPLPSAAPCALQHGVDPNRNYGQSWGGPGASAAPHEQDYRGSGPWSEPETKNVHELSQKRNVTTIVSIHTVAALVLRSPGLKSAGLAPDEPALKGLGDAMAKATGYVSQYSWQLYDTTGTTEDWNYAAAGTFGYTIEMGPTGGEFHHSYETGVVDEWNGVGKLKGKGLKEALLLAAENATDRKHHSTLTGRAPEGRILRVRKEFNTLTSPICTANNTIVPRVAGDTPVSSTIACAAPSAAQQVPDFLDYSMTVPAGGRFDWIITPSSRPFELRAGKAERWTLTCEDPGTKRIVETQQVLIGRGETRSIDMPCGGVLPEDAPPVVADTLGPKVSFLKRTLRGNRRGFYVQGKAADLAPVGAIGELARIEVAVALRKGSRCRFLGRSGRPGSTRSCSRPVYRRAAGTTQWTYVMRKKLRRGRYLAVARGIDRAGNTGRKTVARFTVR